MVNILCQWKFLLEKNGCLSDKIRELENEDGKKYLLAL